LSSEEKKKISARPIDNAQAYDCYLRAYREIMSFSKDRLEHALKLLHNGIDIIGENAVFYAGIAFTYFQYANLGFEQEKYIKKAEEFVTKAFMLDPELAEANFVSGCINQVFHGKAHESIGQFQRAHSIKPEDPEIMTWLAWGYVLVGRMDAAMSLTDRCIKIDPINPMNYAMKGIIHLFQGQFDLAQKPLLDMHKMVPESSMWQFWKSIVLLYNVRPKESYDFINECVKEPGQDTIAQMAIFLKYVLKGDKNKLSRLLTPDFIKAARKDCQGSWHMATFYSYLGEKDQSLEWLENAVDKGFINYPFLDEHDKLLNSIRGNDRFKKLMERVKHEWENFEV
jgi:tetratricopeptide (TPR) repeat protein